MSSISGQSLGNQFLVSGSVGASTKVGQLISHNLTAPAVAAKQAAILLSDSAPTATDHVGIGRETGGGITLKTSANTYGLGSSAGFPSITADGNVVYAESAVDPDGKINGSRIALTKVSDGTAAGAAINFGTYADGSATFAGIQKTAGGDVLILSSDGVAPANTHSYQFSEGATAGIALDAQLMLSRPATHLGGQLSVDKVFANKTQTGATAGGAAILLGTYPDANTVYKGIQTNAANDVQILTSDGVVPANSHIYSFSEGAEASIAVGKGLVAPVNWLGSAFGGPSGFVTTPAISNVLGFAAGPTLIGVPIFIRIGRILAISGSFNAFGGNVAINSFQFGCDQMTVNYANNAQAWGGFYQAGNIVPLNPAGGTIISAIGAPRVFGSTITIPGAAYAMASDYSFFFMVVDNDPS
jgi:hypothetical protein